MNSQEEKLQQEILADAKKQAEKIVAKAENAVARGLKNAQEENDRKREEYLRDLAVEIDSRCQSMRVKTSLTVRRNWLLYREKLMQDFFQQALADAEKLSGEEMASSLECLSREALANLGAGEYNVYFSPADRDAVTEEKLMKTAAGLSLEGCVFHLFPELEKRRGIIFQTPDERRTFDNTFANRLRIMQEDFRKEIFA